MNPPQDVYDAEGKLYEDRRHGGRREDDPSPEVVRGFEWFVRFMFLHKGKIIAACSALAGTSGYLIGQVGVVSRVSALERVVNRNSTAITVLQENDRFKTYLLCVLVRKTDPEALPAECPLTPPRIVP